MTGAVNAITGNLPIGFLFGALTNVASDAIGPIYSKGFQLLRTDFLNFNDIAADRMVNYELNRISTIPNNQNPALFGPVRMDLGKLLAVFNQLPWHLYDDDPDSKFRQWKKLEDELRYIGIRLALPNNAADFMANPNDWQRLIEMTGQGPDLGQVIRDYYRGYVNETDLNFNLQRAGLRRKPDRDRVLSPGYNWSPIDVMKLFRGGIIGADEYDGSLKSSGIVRDEDRERLNAIADPIPITTIVARLNRGQIDEGEARRLLALAGIVNESHQSALLGLRYVLPGPELLSQWANVALWNEDFARRYELDEGYEDSPLATFYAKAQGVTQSPPLPGQPAGSTDWFKLMYRSKNEMPSFVDCLHMQRRLRADPNNPNRAIVGNVPPWTLQNTLDVMKMKGLTPFFTRAMEAALVYEPLNLRFINHLLEPFLMHEEFAAQWTPIIGPPERWVKAAMLDHGYRPEICDAAAAGLIQQGKDSAELEAKNNRVRLRSENRNSVLRDYELGTITRARAIEWAQDKFMSAELAEQEVDLIDYKVNHNIIARKVKTIRDEYFGGKLDLATTGNELTAVGITDERKRQYLEEWSWERTEKTRMLTTQEILQAVKTGMLAPHVALQRLTNLGWAQADAMLRVSAAQQSLATAQQKTAAAQATKQRAQAEKLHREQLATAKAQAAELAKQRKENVKVQAQVANAGHQKLLATSEYYRKVHASNSSFAKAEAAGDDEKMQAEIFKQMSAYQDYLLDQLKLTQKGPEVANVVNPIDRRQAPLPERDQGDDASRSADADATVDSGDASPGAGG
jgi:hypothetical protein